MLVNQAESPIGLLNAHFSPPAGSKLYLNDTSQHLVEFGQPQMALLSSCQFFNLIPMVLAGRIENANEMVLPNQ